MNFLSLIKLHKMSNKMYKKFPKISKMLDFLIYILYNSAVFGSTNIGKNTIFAYGGIGVVIHKVSKIGENCVIGQGITIGGKSGSDRVPIIENNVYIGAGVRILGGIKIGHHSIIAPNAVVLEDVLPFSIYAGIPAKKIDVIDKKNIEKFREYIGRNDDLLKYF